jgi:hypothetical protein
MMIKEVKSGFSLPRTTEQESSELRRSANMDEQSNRVSKSRSISSGPGQDQVWQSGSPENESK